MCRLKQHNLKVSGLETNTHTRVFTIGIIICFYIYCSIAFGIGATVVESLRPMLDDIRTSVGNVEKTVSNLEETVSNLEETVSDLVSRQDDIDAKLASNMEWMSVSLELEQNLNSEVKNTYDLLEEHVGYKCGGERGWRRVVYLNITDPNTDCPSGWRLITHTPKRTCGRANARSNKVCDSAFFPVTGGDYSRVCGSIRAYQQSFTDTFELYNSKLVTTIDEAYVSGISLTHGSPRQHIWTFAAGTNEDRPDSDDACPCDTTMNITIPSFVGEHYFCESGWSAEYREYFAEADPLWDGKGCTSTSTYCEFNNPPYFTKQLSNHTTDDIEARICHWEPFEDTPVEFIELYVK